VASGIVKENAGPHAWRARLLSESGRIWHFRKCTSCKNLEAQDGLCKCKFLEILTPYYVFHELRSLRVYQDGVDLKEQIKAFVVE